MYLQYCGAWATSKQRRHWLLILLHQKKRATPTFSHVLFPPPVVSPSFHLRLVFSFSSFSKTRDIIPPTFPFPFSSSFDLLTNLFLSLPSLQRPNRTRTTPAPPSPLPAMASPLSHWWAFRSGSPDWTASPVTVAATAAIATATIFIVSRDILWPKWAKVLKSPLKTTLPRMKKEEVACLSYQPDQFPGARDVETPVRIRC